MSRRKYAIGDKVNHWTIIDYTDIKYKCKCICGFEKILRSSELNRSKRCWNCASKSLSEKCVISLLGKRFGKLVVMERVGTRNKRPIWKCLCDCGKYRITYSNALMHNPNNQCGKCRKKIKCQKES